MRHDNYDVCVYAIQAACTSVHNAQTSACRGVYINPQLYIIIYIYTSHIHGDSIKSKPNSLCHNISYA